MICAIFKAFAEGDNEKAKDLFVPIYRFCKSTGQNGRILPNSILHSAIKDVTGIKLGYAIYLWFLPLGKIWLFLWES